MCVSRAFDGALELPTAARWRQRRMSVIQVWPVHNSLCLLGTQRQRKLPFMFSLLNKTKQKILHPALLRGKEWRVHHLPKSSSLHLWVACLRASCSFAYCQVWKGPGWAGWLPCEWLHGSCLPLATSRLRGCGQRTCEGSSCRMYLISTENCWVKFSTASTKRLVWDTGTLRNRTLSASLMSAKHSQKWHSWTTSMHIAGPRELAVTFVA